jgi:predicted dehydrogenase
MHGKTGKQNLSRRQMIAAATAAPLILPSGIIGRAGATPPSDKVNIAFIGIGGYGARGLEELASQNIVALCDVDWRPASATVLGKNAAAEVAARYPSAKRFDDWRIMLQEMDKSIDSVLVCTADHTHAIAAITAMKMGKHVFCDKPLAHSITEVRAMMAAQSRYKVSTQTGVQGHASEDCRRIVEWIRDGAIGTVKEVHLFEGARPQTASTAAQKSFVGPYESLAHVHDDVPVPPEVKWDLWLGPAANRPFNTMYIPQRWRSWVDFGTGVLGDHGPHFIDPAQWALDLGLPETIEAETDPEYEPQKNTQTFPRMAIVRYGFPARGKMPAVTLTWHCNHMPPLPQGWKAEEKFPTGGGAIIGSKGAIVYGALYQSKPGQPLPGQVRLVPEELDKAYKRPDPTLPRPSSHWLEWVESSRAGKQPSADFHYGGIVTQIALLGDIAIRHRGQSLQFDRKKGQFTNSASANQMFESTYRLGWKLPA